MAKFLEMFRGNVLFVHPPANAMLQGQLPRIQDECQTRKPLLKVAPIIFEFFFCAHSLGF